MPLTQLPSVPVRLSQLPAYLAQHPDEPLAQLFQPYRKFEATVRELYAQESNHPALKDAHVNVLPIFTEDTPKIQVRARDLAAESEDEKAKYIMALPEDNRRLGGTMATVPSLKAFQNNFAVFSELSLSEISWDSVVAAGSSVVNCLLPVPDEYRQSKRSLREYYHEKFCPASDVDLFLYGLTEEEAIEKIKEIETAVRNSILAETTTIRTKNAITICSQYPTRHIQIVLRIYKSVSEILTGFDIDCSGAAYDGSQVYCTPRALQSYMTQINHIDLTRRSPSYENRLSKYSHRNFEIYWPELDRSRIDPTIFDRSFRRTLGLARLLVLERLPTSQNRQEYSFQRRRERGRPDYNGRGVYHVFNDYTTTGNIKENFDDEIAEWESQEDVSGYDTFVIPYGRSYHARKIEKLCYTRDLLLNAEWNHKKDREVYLHRHPAFFGRAEDVIKDCCGFCPEPKTEQEKAIAEKESKTYVSGELIFIRDDPGRQQIGSFNPLTDDDWTEMAYIGNTAVLCQAIVDHDLEHVRDWLNQDGANPNRRDYTGRTPLHLAVLCSTPTIVQCLVDRGARLIARLADGKTALHLAAERGSVEIVKILMDKSMANQAEEEEKEDRRRQVKAITDQDKQGEGQANSEDDGDNNDDDNEEEEDGEEEDGELIDGQSSDDFSLAEIAESTAEYLKVEAKTRNEETFALDDDAEVADVLMVDVLAWDRPCSAVHFAIMAGHEAVVSLLCEEYGATVILPIKFFNSLGIPYAALLTLNLAMSLPTEKAKSMVSTLLSIGATSAQGDLNGVTPFFGFARSTEVELLEVLLEQDKTGSSRAINHVSFPDGRDWSTPLLAAISVGDAKMVSKLLEAGASTEVTFDSWRKAGKSVNSITNFLRGNKPETLFNTSAEQPLIAALQGPNVSIALDLLEHGADPDTETRKWQLYKNPDTRWWRDSIPPQSALGVVREHIKTLKAYSGEQTKAKRPFKLLEGADSYLKSLDQDSWFSWAASVDVLGATRKFDDELAKYEEELERLQNTEGVAEKAAAISDTIVVLHQIEQNLVTMSCKSSEEKEELKSADAAVYAPVEFTKDYEFSPEFVANYYSRDTEKTAYARLFNAAWHGDLATIKKLTLAAWADESGNLQTPLLASVSCSGHSHNSLFSLAFLRGHYKVATAILEIIQAQYYEEGKEKVRYELRDGDDSCSDCCCNDSTDDGEMYRTIIDNDEFTIENVGEVSMQVQGIVKPLEVLVESCTTFVMLGSEVAELNLDRRTLLRTVFANKDRQGLQFLLDTAIHFCGLKTGGSSEELAIQASSLFKDDFEFAMSQGHIDMLAEVIKRTGVGLPLERMVKDTGIEVKVRPRYYQGLTVYGKKRSDWADAGRSAVRKPTGLNSSPLLLAATSGRLETVEWFLSDAPLRCYLEFTQSEGVRDDPQVRHLGEAPGGTEGAISQWLKKDSNLVLLQAIVDADYDKVLPLAKYLVKAVPDSVTAEIETGRTPLIAACGRGHVDTVRLLIGNGADQGVRQKGTFENLLHEILHQYPSTEELKSMLDALDPDALARMFGERSHHTALSDGRTPLHDWVMRCVMSEYNGSYGDKQAYKGLDDMLDVLRLLLTYSGGRELEQVDSTGNTLLHSLVTTETDPRIVSVFLEADPGQRQALLLHHENAVGLTPREACWDWYLSETVVSPRWCKEDPLTDVSTWPKRTPRKFWDKARRPQGEGRAAAGLLHAVEELAQQHPGKRKLASLLEAEDVTKRIDSKYAKKRYATKVRATAAEVAASDMA